MTSIPKANVTADTSLLVSGETIDASDVITPVDDLVANDRAGLLAVTANDLNVKNLDDAISVAAGLLAAVTSPAGDEALQIALSTELTALNALLAPTTGKIQAAAMDSEVATSGYVATANGIGGVSYAAAGGGGATPVDENWTAGENLAERDLVYLDQSTNTAFKFDADAVGAIAAGRIRAVVNEAGGILSAASGSVRRLGEVSGYAGLTAGGDVYASTTPGGITQTKPTVTAGGGQVAIARIGHATSTTNIMVWPGIVEFLKRESLANDATLTIEHYNDALARSRDLSANVSGTDVGAALAEYDEANFNYDVWMRGPSGAGATITPDASGTSPITVGFSSPDNIRVAQAFLTTAGRLTQITAYFLAKIGAPTGSITWNICDDNGGIPGTVLQSGTFIPADNADAVITVANGIFLAASTTYWLLFESVDFQVTPNSWQLAFEASGVYSDGAMYWDRTLALPWPDTWAAGGGTNDMRCSITTVAETTKDKLAQSFQISPGATVDKVQLYLKKLAAPTGTMTLRIETDAAGDPSGALADANATITVAESSLATSYGWIVFDFAVDFALSASTTYWIVLSTDRVASGTNYVALGSDTTPSYPDGEMKSEASATWSAESKDAIFSVNPADTIFEEVAVLGRWGGGTRDIAARMDDGAGADPATNTTFKNVSGVTLDVTCVVELE